MTEFCAKPAIRIRLQQGGTGGGRNPTTSQLTIPFVGEARSNDCEPVAAHSLLLVSPGDTERVQDKFVVQTQLGGIEEGLPRTQDFEVLRYAPELMVTGVLAILAGQVG